MKNLLFIFLLITATGLSQEKFIEVLVKDTIALKPISFEYVIKSDIEMDFDNTGDGQRSQRIKEADKRALSFLQSGNYDFEENDIKILFATLGGIQPKSFSVFIPNLTSKHRFLEDIKRMSGIDYNLVKTNYEQNEATEEKIYTKLLAKADNRAVLLGNIKNLKIGEIIEISESKGPETTFSNFMEKMMAASTLDVTTTFMTSGGILEKSISVKYSVY